MENNIWYALSTGVFLYTVKEIVRLGIDTRINVINFNLEKLYPIYLDAFGKVKFMIGHHRTPFSQKDTFQNIYDDVLNNIDKKQRNLYINNDNYRKVMNLYRHIEKMENAKYEFNNFFSANQVFFEYEFVVETIAMVNEFESDISYLRSMVNNYMNNYENLIWSNIITDAYKHKVTQYEIYLDKFEEEFRKKFKIKRESRIKKFRRNIKNRFKR